MSRTALGTGGTRGLGKAMSIALQARGCRVAAVYGGNREAAQKFTAETSIPAYRWDVANFDDCKSGVAQVENEFGRIDILANNAGITSDAVLHRMTPEQWWRVITTNLGSMFDMCRHVVEGMRERGFGRIININSVNGRKGQVGQTNNAVGRLCSRQRSHASRHFSPMTMPVVISPARLSRSTAGST